MTWHQLGSRPRPALEDKLPRGRPRASAWARDNDAASGAGAPCLSFSSPLAAGRPPAEAAPAPHGTRWCHGLTGRPACGMDRQPPNDDRAIATGRARGPGARDAAVSHSFCFFFLAVGSAVDGSRGDYAGHAPAPVHGHFLQRLRDIGEKKVRKFARLSAEMGRGTVKIVVSCSIISERCARKGPFGT